MFSGSTMVSVLMQERKLYCANVGDSRALIGAVENNREFVIYKI